jgi:hypothetical protein
MQEFTDRIIIKIPNWLRWLLVLPTALLADLVAQSFYRILLYAIPFHGIQPYSDELIWRVFAPIVFVAAGLKMAPRYWLRVACVLIGIKSAIALFNIYTLGRYLLNGGSAYAPAFVTSAPVWWSLLSNVLFLAFAVLTVAIDKNIRKEPSVGTPVLDF